MREGVECFLRYLENERGFSANTIAAYRNDLMQFAGFLEDQRRLTTWRALTDDELKSYLLYLHERGYATSTVARKTAALRSFCSFLVDQEHIRADPTESLASPRVAKNVPRAMTKREVEQLFNQLLSSESSDVLRDLAMLKLLYGTGMRVSELVSLDLSDLDLENERVHCSGKQGRNRDIPLPPDVCGTLREYIERHRARVIAGNTDEQALFLNHRGQRLTRQGFWLILKNHAEAAGIDDITPHTLRHSFAAHQVLDGRDLSDVRDILGHVSISTTQVYEQLAQNMRSSTQTTEAVQRGDE